MFVALLNDILGENNLELIATWSEAANFLGVELHVQQEVTQFSAAWLRVRMRVEVGSVPSLPALGDRFMQVPGCEEAKPSYSWAGVL